jgi:hypothetical protein
MSFRAIFLVGFVIAMPVLALPAVARRMDEWLYGSAATPLPPSPAAAPLPMQVVEPTTAERASPASYVEVDVPPATGRRGAEADVQIPDFPPEQALPWSVQQPASQTSLSASQMNRLREIRQALEDLGAQYILLEMTEGTSEYRFHCQMKVSDNAPYTREFEASGPEPLAAGEQVLVAARNWHAAAGETARR